MLRSKLIVFALLLLIQVCQVQSLGTLRSKANPNKLRNRSIWNKKFEQNAQANYKGPEPVSFQTRLDHFNGTVNDTNATLPTFALRYIINDEFNPNKTGPILFYAGNEGGIEGFYENSGFMTRTLAERMNATVVFGEHRYYGESFPFDSKEVALQPENLKYLSVEQVMMDYVTLLENIKSTGGYDKTGHHNPRTPIYVFGGSYGGMLATWLRMKYPTTFHGAIASSAPILWFNGAKDFDPHAYDSITDQAARKLYGQECVTWYQQGFYDLIQAQYINSTYENITKEFNICNSTPIVIPENVEMLTEILSDNIGSMAMVNYPYNTSFLHPLPAWPLNTSCAKASGLTFDDANNETASTFNFQNIKRLAAMNSIWQGDECIQLYDETADKPLDDVLDGDVWEIQTCHELPMPLTESNRWNWGDFYKDGFTQYCQEKYGLTPMYNWATDFFGGRDPRRDFRYATNIVFFNGELDPWHGGGVNTNITAGTTAIFTKLAAHHYDLRDPHPNDTVQIQEARDIEYMHLSKWLANWRLDII